ncbi:TetR/AcrR family transcriptional regulator [Chloroflexia bacterium SDU3-3]|nr:TetR/AcrR family transcriptional regulator [Chloroflexia bacterium SDU3-3]
MRRWRLHAIGPKCPVSNIAAQIVHHRQGEHVKNTKADRRSQRTRQLLSDALVALIQEKRYSEITIQDIIDRANIGRSTFYAHYLDKDDLFESYVNHGLDRLREHIRRADHGSAHERIDLTILFEHVHAHHALYNALVKGGSIALVYAKGQDRLRHNIEQHLEDLMPSSHVPPMPISLIAEYVAGTIVHLITWWLDHGMAHTPSEMNEMFVQLVAPGLEEALHLPRELMRPS